MKANFSYTPVTESTVNDLISIFGKSGVSVDKEKLMLIQKMKSLFTYGIKNTVQRSFVLEKQQNRYRLL